MTEGAGAVSAPSRTVTIDLSWIADDADAISAITDQLDEIADRLRDLADPRITLPDLATLRERLREWAADLEHASEEVYSLADGIRDRVHDALDDDDDDDDDDDGEAGT
jgi:hypothetical protein